MTEQEIFDEVATRLLAQGKPSMRGIVCVYRAPDGSKCAAGWLIPDELYDPMMEGKRISANREKLPEELHDHILFIQELQEVHDFANRKNWLSSWKQRMASIAQDHNLNPAVLGDIS